jgi:hypothetical protein
MGTLTPSPRPARHPQARSIRVIDDEFTNLANVDLGETSDFCSGCFNGLATAHFDLRNS